ncbi:hypothetical protein ACJX0J_017371, partial [Zea mays]
MIFFFIVGARGIILILVQWKLVFTLKSDKIHIWTFDLPHSTILRKGLAKCSDHLFFSILFRWYLFQWLFVLYWANIILVLESDFFLVYA